ncbi:hypothetical protein OGAPHI_003796 [Ogataea philodendri]|uniref:Uncharacterized protein n=1 Tax=Ogataea philodendri TaxID=1378263 RepID=A0A9P8P509_9ASCO|nr:uncharacterized protein OGAPHI_003796 [Ogataea philodendri]KAH3665608.1 hypothetical protein OGAPHI_003796 [Ogataea philodendri]
MRSPNQLWLSRYVRPAESSVVSTTAPTNGKFLVTDSLYGGPAVSNTPTITYWKLPNRNSTVLSVHWTSSSFPGTGGMYQLSSASFIDRQMENWKPSRMQMLPSNGIRILGDIRLAVGRLAHSRAYGLLHAMNTASGMIRNRSMYRNWKSPRLVPSMYSMVTVMNWIAEYSDMNWKHEKLVTSDARPSLITSRTHEISKMRDVNGAATDASASLSEIPTSAALSAPQSFAPSPQKPTV